MARFRVLTDTFIAPNLYREGTIIDYVGTPGPHFQPLDQDAHDSLLDYYEKNPGASLNPTEALSRTIGGTGAQPASASPILPARPMAYVEAILGDSWNQPASAGVTDGGQIPQDQQRTQMVYIPAPTLGGPGPRVMQDPPGIGSNAPTSDVPLDLNPAPWPNNPKGDGRDVVRTMDAIGNDPFDAHPSRTPAQDALLQARTSGTGSSGLQPAADNPALGKPEEPGSKPEVAQAAAKANASADTGKSDAAAILAKMKG